MTADYRPSWYASSSGPAAATAPSHHRQLPASRLFTHRGVVRRAASALRASDDRRADLADRKRAASLASEQALLLLSVVRYGPRYNGVPSLESRFVVLD